MEFFADPRLSGAPAEEGRIRLHGYLSMTPVSPARILAAATFTLLAGVAVGVGIGPARSPNTVAGTAQISPFPRDLARVTSIPERKQRFLDALVPVVEAENQRVAAARRWLLDRRGVLASGRLFAGERRFLDRLVRDYRLPKRLQPPPTGPVPEATVAELLLRVDTLPSSLVLAQAAMESGWGKSRFVHEGNNLFGQWVTGDTPGLVPHDAGPDADYRLAAYDCAAQSVRSYLRNINTHRAYRSLRRLRARLRAEGRPLDGTALAAGLRAYSQRGEAYVTEIRRIIRHNRLEPVAEITLAAATLPSGR